MKTTQYFKFIKSRPDRSFIKNEWIQYVIKNPESVMTQTDGRIKIWGKIAEMDNRYLRVILLEDRETIHNAFFDRRYKNET